MQSLVDSVLAAIIFAFARLAASVPPQIRIVIGKFLGLTWFYLVRLRRKVAYENVSRCFPEWSEEKKWDVVRQSYIHMGLTGAEVLAMARSTTDDWTDHFEFEGLDNIRSAIDKGRGVFILTLHLGNGDLATVGLKSKGIGLHVISKEFKSKWLNDFWFQSRKNFGTQFIADRGSSIGILRVLKSNGVIGFMIDQFMGPPLGIKTQFFGHDTGTAKSLALLAGRSGAAVVPMYSFRKPNGKLCIVAWPEIPFVNSTNTDETILRMTQGYNDVVESIIRQHPEQWMWVHRRWKRFRE
jgi:KDO2-lipid IV(A) lauroyltransferase